MLQLAAGAAPASVLVKWVGPFVGDISTWAEPPGDVYPGQQLSVTPARAQSLAQSDPDWWVVTG